MHIYREQNPDKPVVIELTDKLTEQVYHASNALKNESESETASIENTNLLQVSFHEKRGMSSAKKIKRKLAKKAEIDC